MKIATSAFILLAMAATAHAIPVTTDSATYDFSGTLGDHFQTLIGADAPQVTVQQNDQLEYHNGNTTDVDLGGGGALVHNSFRPRYDQSWEASVDLTVPLAYNTLQGTPPLDENQFVSVGLIALFNPDNDIDSSNTRLFVTSLAVQDSQEPAFRSFIVDQEPRTGPPHFVATPLGTVRVRIEYDAEAETLSAFHVAEHLHTISTSNWGMTSSDPFNIVIFTDSKFAGVDPQTPLSLDNFNASIVVPEPTSLLLVLMGLVGWVQGRHR